MERELTAVELPEATVPAEGNLTWESQVRQYPKVGPPGLTYEQNVTAVATGPVVALDPRDDRVKVARGTYRLVTDCLLYRNSKGRLVGILNRYPEDCVIDGRVVEAAGNINLFVHPRRRRRGIGRRLVREAVRRWDPDWSQQSYTAAGRALVASVLTESETP